jgi:adenylate kinase family enzyme
MPPPTEPSAPGRLPAGVRRVLVAGSPGAGKTTMARALAGRLDLPHTELDALFHGPGWVPRREFEADVDALLASGRWVTEYQYARVRPRLLAAADAVVWLDHPWPTVAGRLLRRTVDRAVRRRELYNGNREVPRNWLRGSHPLWTVAGRRFSRIRAENAARFAAEARRRGLVVVRLRGARAADRWLAAQGSPSTRGTA